MSRHISHSSRIIVLTSKTILKKKEPILVASLTKAKFSRSLISKNRTGKQPSVLDYELSPYQPLERIKNRLPIKRGTIASVSGFDCFCPQVVPRHGLKDTDQIENEKVRVPGAHGSPANNLLERFIDFSSRTRQATVSRI